MEILKIVIADDHPIIIDALKMMVQSRNNWQVVGEAKDGIELLDTLKNIQPDIVIVDLEMPRMKGYETITEIKRQYPSVYSIVLSGFVNEKNKQRALQAGAYEIISKGDSMKCLMEAIERVNQGNHPPIASAAKHAGENLTLREKQIITLLAEGKTSKEISSLLHISQWTVNKHRSNIMEKLEIKNVIELVRYAISNGYAFLPQSD